MFSSCFASIEFITGNVIALAAIAGTFLAAILIPVFALYFQHRKRQLWHETARVALEKGQPMPPMPEESGLSKEEFHEAIQHSRGGKNDLRSGLILIGVGAG
ncbi:MAG: hypothetical protein ACHQ5A_03035, partial [Opitutales bacterium]